MKKILILLLLSAIVCSGCSQRDEYLATDSLNTEASVADENTEEGSATELPLMNTATDLSEAEIGDNVKAPVINTRHIFKYQIYKLFLKKRTGFMKQTAFPLFLRIRAEAPVGSLFPVTAWLRLAELAYMAMHLTNPLNFLK